MCIECKCTTYWCTAVRDVIPSLFIYLFGRVYLVYFVGSLSKGTEEHVRALIDAGLIQLMLSIVTNSNADKYLVEISLCVIRSIYEHSFAPSEIIHSNSSTLVHMIGECTAII